jgi:hypothetical protein
MLYHIYHGTLPIPFPYNNQCRVSEHALRMNIYISILGVVFAMVWSGSTNPATGTSKTAPVSYTFRNASDATRPLPPLEFAHSGTFASTVNVNMSNSDLPVMEKREDIMDITSIPLKARIDQARV